MLLKQVIIIIIIIFFKIFLLNTIFINSSSGAWFEGVWGARHPL